MQSLYGIGIKGQIGGILQSPNVFCDLIEKKVIGDLASGRQIKNCLVGAAPSKIPNLMT